jgi:hypothetical protein
MEIMLLIFGGRKARQAYREHTQAIIDRTAAVRALNASRDPRPAVQSEWNGWLQDQREGLRRDKEAIEAGWPLEPIRPWRGP